VDRQVIFRGMVISALYAVLTGLEGAGLAQGTDPDPQISYKIVAKHSGRVLDVFDVSQDDHAQVQQHEWNGGNNQGWRLVPFGDGYYKLFALHSGKVLDVEGLNPNSGARIQQFQSNGGNNQRWKLEPAGDGYYYIVSKLSGRVLEVPGGNQGNIGMQLFDKNGGDNQKFKFERFMPMGEIRVMLSALRCNDTTEWSADEVYILVVGRRNDGTTFSARLPKNAFRVPEGHWDMNDSGESHDNQKGDSRKITNKILFSNQLPEGATWDLAIIVMEEDDGTTINVLDSIIQKLGMLPAGIKPFDYVVQIVGGVLRGRDDDGFIGFRDTDDYIGSFAVHVTRRNGAVVPEWRKIDRINHTQNNINGIGEFEYEIIMNGDGSSYPGWYRIIQ
jgi:Ricin-type beta-trefoil lectin domain-like